MRREGALRAAPCARQASQQDEQCRGHRGHRPRQEPESVSQWLGGWLSEGGGGTLGDLIDAVAEKSFAMLFVVLLSVPALPLPTGGATHLFEIIAALLALQLIIGRDEIWLPQRWRRVKLTGHRERFVFALVTWISRLEPLSRPRLRFLFNHRLSNRIFGLLVMGGCAGAFFAPPFTGLDTLPALGVVLLSLGVLLEDFLFVVIALAVGIAGVVIEILLGKAALELLGRLV